MSDLIREVFERHCPTPKALKFIERLNRYDGGVYTNALEYNDMWCAWQYAWQAALQHTQQPSPEGYVFCDKKGVVVNNNLKDSQVLIACPPHTTIPVGTVMVACQHPDVIDDGCVICGININPNSDDWRTDLNSAGKEAV